VTTVTRDARPGRRLVRAVGRSHRLQDALRRSGPFLAGQLIWSCHYVLMQRPSALVELPGTCRGGRLADAVEVLDLSVPGGWRVRVAYYCPERGRESTLRKVLLGALPPPVRCSRCSDVAGRGGRPRSAICARRASTPRSHPGHRPWCGSAGRRPWCLRCRGPPRFTVLGRPPRRECARWKRPCRRLGVSAACRSAMLRAAAHWLLIAQSLVRRPGLLLLDEPLDSLDCESGPRHAALTTGLREAGVGRVHGRAQK